jgi:hypothetical protein
MRPGALGLLKVGLLMACACQRQAPPRSVGRQLVEGGAQGLMAAPAGGALVFLLDPEHPTGPLIPSDALLGTVTLVSADGSVHVLGRGGTNLAGAFLFSRDGRWLAYLSGFDFATHLGRLSLASSLGSSPPRELVASTGYFGFSPDNKWLGYVAAGRLMMVATAGGEPIELAEGVGTFEFSPDSQAMIYRHSVEHGGELVSRSLGPERRTTHIASGVADYLVDEAQGSVAYTVFDASHVPELHVWRSGQERRLGTGVPGFKFSPDGRWLAFVSGIDSKHKEVPFDFSGAKGDLFLAAVDGVAAPLKIGSRIEGYRFSPSGRELAFLDGYDEQSRSGKLTVWKAPTAIVPLAGGVPLFGWSHTGKYLAYLQRVIRPLYTERLLLSRTDDLCAGTGCVSRAPRDFGTAVYAFDFSPDDDKLLFKTACASEGLSCDLMAAPAMGPASTPKPLADGGIAPERGERLAMAIEDYDYSPDGHWLSLSFADPTGHRVDLAVVPSGEFALPRYIDTKVEPHSRWLANGSIAYLVNGSKRRGLFVARAEDARSAAEGRGKRR